MAKFLLVLFALCVVPSIVAARQKPLLLKGSVYCDTCRAGYETSASEPLAGAVVNVECRSRDNAPELTFLKQAVTNPRGNYHVLVHEDLGNDVCDAVLVKSSNPSCGTPNSGRDRARVILTRNNGIASNLRFANALGFLKDKPLAKCGAVMMQYQDNED